MSHTYFYTLKSASRRGAEVPLQRPTTRVGDARSPCRFCCRAANKSRELRCPASSSLQFSLALRVCIACKERIGFAISPSPSQVCMFDPVLHLEDTKPLCVPSLPGGPFILLHNGKWGYISPEA